MGTSNNAGIVVGLLPTTDLDAVRSPHSRDSHHVHPPPAFLCHLIDKGVIDSLNGSGYSKSPDFEPSEC